MIRVSSDLQSVSYTEEHGLPSQLFNHCCRNRRAVMDPTMGGICKIRQSTGNGSHGGRISSNDCTFVSEGEMKDLLLIGTQDGVNVFRDGIIKELRTREGKFQAQNVQQINRKIIFIKDSELYEAHPNEGDFNITKENFISSLPGFAIEMVRDDSGAILIASTKGISVWYNHRLTNLKQNRVITGSS